MTMTTTMHTRTKVVIAFLVVILISISGLFMVYTTNIKAVQNESEVVYFDVVDGDSLRTVLSRLEEDEIIRSAFFARFKARSVGQQEVYIGTFALDRSWDVAEILDYLSHPSFGAVETEVTLVEGSWARDMARTLSESIAVSETRLLELWNDPTYVQSLIDKFDVLPQDIMNNPHARVLLEGFLYPDTYRFYVRATEEEVTEIILNNSNAKFKTYKDRLPSDLSQFEFMTLASIVEYEASSDEDMRLVAGVFRNRLDIGMKLQSSVTICYALYDFDSWEECESAANNQLDNPYNTYVHLGLPPGPILNPSLRAIEATLDYTKSSYLFFIADVHNVVDGKVHYQTTYEQHVKDRILLLGY